MKVFVTGASGFVGRGLVPDLVAAGHEVVGLARSDAAAATVEQAGGTVVRGSLDDVEVIAQAAAASDGVVHLGFKHDFVNDFSLFVPAVDSDRAVIDALGDALAGSDRPLVIASGLLGMPADRTATEDDPFSPEGGPRAANALATLALADRGVRASVVRLAPTVHGADDRTGFVTLYAGTAREKGEAGYVDDGANRWPAVHRDDAATLFRLAVESAPAGAILHGTAEDGVPFRQIAEGVAAGLGVPTASVPAADATAYFGGMGSFYALDVTASHAKTAALLGWEPTGPSLLDDVRDVYAKA